MFVLNATGPNEKPRKWVSMKDEPPSEFFTRIVRDMERYGANVLPYLVGDLTKYANYKEEVLKREDANRKKT